MLMYEYLISIRMNEAPSYNFDTYTQTSAYILAKKMLTAVSENV